MRLDLFTVITSTLHSLCAKKRVQTFSSIVLGKIGTQTFLWIVIPHCLAADVELSLTATNAKCCLLPFAGCLTDATACGIVKF